MDKNKWDISRETGQHSRLINLVGSWDGMTSTWFEKNVLADESLTVLKIISLIETRFIQFEYRGSVNKQPNVGKMTWGYDVENKKCQCCWMDSFHTGTGMMYSEGDETGNGFSVLGSYRINQESEAWGWRTDLEIINSDQFILRTFNISPQGDEAKATETIFHRLELSFKENPLIKI